MRLAGDLTDRERETIPELQKFEIEVDGNSVYPNDGKAMMYVCLAHDWYQMDMEEEGSRLLLKADKVCPGYFKNEILKHQSENPTFDKLVGNLTLELVNLLTDSLRNK